jgi:hypothetical protein
MKDPEQILFGITHDLCPSSKWDSTAFSCRVIENKRCVLAYRAMNDFNMFVDLMDWLQKCVTMDDAVRVIRSLESIIVTWEFR